MRILLADNQPKVRFAMRVLLRRQPDLEIVGEATDAQELLTQIEVCCPDAILLGWELPGLKGKDLMAEIHKTCGDLAIIALSGRLEARQDALDAGVDAFVSKGDPPERLLAAISNCCSPEMALS
jgi:two-component system nitrate/nitrite response regulator NarL